MQTLKDFGWNCVHSSDATATAQDAWAKLAYIKHMPIGLHEAPSCEMFGMMIVVVISMKAQSSPATIDAYFRGHMGGEGTPLPYKDVLGKKQLEVLLHEFHSLHGVPKELQLVSPRPKRRKVAPPKGPLLAA